MTHEQILNSLNQKLIDAISFLADKPDLKFIKPTEFRPAWRLIQAEGDAARTLGEASTPYECVLQAMDKVEPDGWI